MDSPAILDKDGNLHLPNGNSASGTSTPSAPNKAQNAVPLPSRGDATGKGSSVGTGTFGVKVGLAQMLKGGVIMDVMNAEQAKIAEEAGAVAVMALEVSRLHDDPIWLLISPAHSANPCRYPSSRRCRPNGK